MWWSAKPKFSTSDARDLVQALQAKIESREGEKIYLQDNLVYTQSLAQSKISSYLLSTPSKTSVQEISETLKLSKPSVLEVLPKCMSLEFTDGIVILPVKLINNIIDQVSNSTTSVNLLEICQQFDLTLSLVIRVMQRSKSHKISVVDEYAISNHVLSENLTKMEIQLTKNVEFEYAAIIKDLPCLKLVKQKLQIPQFETKFKPAATNTETENLVLELNEHGGIHVSKLANTAKFCKANECVQIGYFVVKQKYIASLKSEILQSLRQCGYYDLSSLKFGLSKYFLQDEKFKEFPNSNEYLVKPSYLLELAEKLALNREFSFLACQQVNDVEIDIHTDIESVLRSKTAPLSLETVLSLAPDVPKPVIELAMVNIRQKFYGKVREALVSKHSKLIQQLEARVVVYKTGLDSIKVSSSLHEKVKQELQQYASSQNVSLHCESSIEEQHEAASALVEKARQQLKRAKDAPTILLLSTLIYHSVKYTQNGMLKIRGKLLPKLLTEFEFPVEFLNLKSEIAKRDIKSAETVREIGLSTSA